MSNIILNPGGDRNDNIVNAAKVLGRSPQRKSVFSAIYYGKRKSKKVSEIAKLAGISNKRVTEEAAKLFAANMIGKSRAKGETFYEKKDFFTHNKTQILKLSNDKRKLENVATKTNPQSNSQIIKISFPQKKVNYKEITVDDIDSFSQVKKVKISTPITKPLAESKIKTGFQKIVGEKGKFTDWGGEINDLFTSRVIFNGKRISTAIAFKGKATKGILTLKKLGKNADQVQRLFKSAARLFIIQYQGPIDQSVLVEMKTHAIAKSYNEGDKIYYSVIDGQDTSRLLQAYPKSFK